MKKSLSQLLSVLQVLPPGTAREARYVLSAFVFRPRGGEDIKQQKV